MKHALVIAALSAAACSDYSYQPDLAGGVRLTGLDVYQGPLVPVVGNGVTVSDRPTPLVAGRPARLVLSLDAASGSEARSLLVRLTLYAGSSGQVQSVRDVPFSIAGAGAYQVLADLDSADITIDTAMVATLHEADPTYVSALPAADGARYPTDGSLPLGAEPGWPLRLVIVPIRNGWAPGKPIPEVDAERQANLEEALWGNYPVTHVELEVADDFIDFDGSVADRDAWQRTLGRLATWRLDHGLSDDTYVYGMVEPTEEEEAALGGLAATLAAEAQDWRAAISVSLPDNPVREQYLIIHEIGHVMGRSHAPCGDPGGPDFSYPYEEGSIGVRGFDLGTGTFREPNAYVDFMSYCSPVFVSDYQYRGLYRTLASLATTERTMIAELPSLTIDAAGVARPGGLVPVYSDQTTHRIGLSGSGRRARTEAIWLPGQHFGGGTLVMRDVPDWVRSIDMPDGRTAKVLEAIR